MPFRIHKRAKKTWRLIPGKYRAKGTKELHTLNLKKGTYPRAGHWVLNVDEPLVEVLWGRTSFFSYEYATKIEGLDWIVQRHPELRDDPRAYGRILGQRAFWEACAGLPEARPTVANSRRLDRRQWRAYLAPLVSRGLVKGETLLAAAHRVGRGI